MAKSSFGTGRRRGFGRARVLVGLSPVLMLGGFMLAENVSALGSGPQFAGSAAATADDAPVAIAGMAPAPVDRARPVAVSAPASPDDAALAIASEAADLPAEPVIPQAKLQDVAAPAAGAKSTADVDAAALGAVLPSSRGLKGWRIAPEADPLQAEFTPDEGAPLADGFELAHAIMGEPGAITVSQPTWNAPTPAPRPNARAQDARAEAASRSLPIPPRRPGSTAAAPARAVPLAISDIAPLDRARVVIHRPGQAAAADASDLLGRLQARGVGRAEIRTVGVDVGRPDIRYFHESDRAVAEQLRAMLAGQGYQAAIRDFTHFSPQPSRGTVEVWLPG